jgi:hypothetical protein
MNSSGTFADRRTLFDELPSGLLAPKSVTAEMLADGAVTERAYAVGSVPATAIKSEAWTAYTPGTNNITLGNGTVGGRWARSGRLVYAVAGVNYGSTSSTTGRPGLGVPVPKAAAFDYIGTGYGLDGGSKEYLFGCRWVNDSTIEWLYDGAPNGVVTTGNPFTVGAGDQMRFMVTYEAAT